MNRNQFKQVRTQLGYSLNAMSEQIGLRKGTIMRLENGADPFTDIPVGYRTSLNHIISFACAWMLFNGGGYIPWPRSEDTARFRAFREFHGMTNDEMAALFDVSIREMEYMTSPTTLKHPRKYVVMALCWMRLFGSRDPFAFPLHEHYDSESANTCPMRIDAPITIEGTAI